MGLFDILTKEHQRFSIVCLLVFYTMTTDVFAKITNLGDSVVSTTYFMMANYVENISNPTATWVQYLSMCFLQTTKWPTSHWMCIHSLLKISQNIVSSVSSIIFSRKVGDICHNYLDRKVAVVFYILSPKPPLHMAKREGHPHQKRGGTQKRGIRN